jgi:antitoxin component YwqK of YwqJK toxin-antitoxin module
MRFPLLFLLLSGTVLLGSCAGSRSYGTYAFWKPNRFDRHGLETGRWRTYYDVTYWHPGGQLARKGSAQWVTGKGRNPRFYWYGPWTSYDANGQITSIQTYDDGNLTRTETYEEAKLTQVETFEQGKRSRVETYADGQLLKVESFEKGLRTGTTNTL